MSIRRTCSPVSSRIRLVAIMGVAALAAAACSSSAPDSEATATTASPLTLSGPVLRGPGPVVGGFGPGGTAGPCTVNCPPLPPSGHHVAQDYDGDGTADFAVWDPVAQLFTVAFSIGFGTKSPYGAFAAGGVPVPGDYDGDGRTDFAMFYPSNGTWTIDYSARSLVESNIAWSVACPGVGCGQIAVPGDYDGDQITDLAVYSPNTPGGAIWSIQFWSGMPSASFQFDIDGSQYVPVPADYDGDGSTDMGVWQPSQDGQSLWQLVPSGKSGANLAPTGPVNLPQTTVAWGTMGQIPVPGDYDGDGKADLATFSPTQNLWYLRFSSGQTPAAVSYGFGDLGDQPAPADYDGDGRTDLAVLRSASNAAGIGTFYAAESSWGSYSTSVATSSVALAAANIPQNQGCATSGFDCGAVGSQLYGCWSTGVGVTGGIGVGSYCMPCGSAAGQGCCGFTGSGRSSAPPLRQACVSGLTCDENLPTPTGSGEPDINQCVAPASPPPSGGSSGGGSSGGGSKGGGSSGGGSSGGGSSGGGSSGGGSSGGTMHSSGGGLQPCSLNEPCSSACSCGYGFACLFSANGNPNPACQACGEDGEPCCTNDVCLGMSQCLADGQCHSGLQTQSLITCNGSACGAPAQPTLAIESAQGVGGVSPQGYPVVTIASGLPSFRVVGAGFPPNETALIEDLSGPSWFVPVDSTGAFEVTLSAPSLPLGGNLLLAMDSTYAYYATLLLNVESM